MRSILIGVKRFLTNKNTITIIAILGSLLLLYWAYNKRIEDATSPKSVVVAVNELGPRTYITNDMVTVKKIPGSVIKEAFASTTEVIGKYVSNDAVIPTNGMFYKGMVKTWEELPRSVYGDIPNGNTVVVLDVDMESTYGNSIFPGNYIDLYFQGMTEDGKLMIQKFIESIKVLAVLDSSGKSVFETNGALPTPQYLMFSVPEDLHLLLRKASAINVRIFPVPRNANYSNGVTKNTRVVSTYLKEFILSKTVNVDEKDEKLTIKSQDGSQIDVMKIESNN